ncbi:MAG: hypothetical protein ABSG53_03575, partial [Thermoguttaceae bacterium]
MLPTKCLGRSVSILLLFGLALAATAARTSNSAEKSVAEPVAKPGENAAKAEYLRVVHDAQDRAVSLETAIVGFVPATANAADVRVDLIAAVHIADKKYYQELNKRFAGYDAVLYELVAPEGTRIPQGGRKDKRAGNMLSAVQLGMKDLLKLEFQL